MRAAVQAAAALLAGAAQTFAFAPFEAWWLQIAALALLVHLARDASPARAGLLGWLFGTGWLAAGLWWCCTWCGLVPPRKRSKICTAAFRTSRSSHRTVGRSRCPHSVRECR